MMGRQSQQQSLFYTITLEEFVPKSHVLRKIDKVLDLSFLHAKIAPFYSAIGRPSIDPELMIRMVLIGYVMGIRSERRLVQEVSLNLAYRWFCRLDLDAKVPHHSSFSKNRYQRFRESEIYRELFEKIVLQCLGQGMIGGEACSVDGCVIAADANSRRTISAEELKDLSLDEEASVSRPVQEYLDALEDETTQEGLIPPENSDPSKPIRKQTPRVRKPKYISKTDPAAAWSFKHSAGEFSYETNYLIDNKKGIILDVEATPARISHEVEAAQAMLQRIKTSFNMTPDRLAADKAYGTGFFLSWLFGQGIKPHIPVISHKHQTGGRFTQEMFDFVEEENRYICPNGESLHFSGSNAANRIDRYAISSKTCRVCILKELCTTGKYRQISRHWDETARQKARALTKTKAFKKSSCERKRVEHRFAHLKQNLSFRRVKLRGLSGASEEFLLAALVQNLKMLAWEACTLIVSLTRPQNTLYPAH